MGRAKARRGAPGSCRAADPSPSALFVYYDLEMTPFLFLVLHERGSPARPLTSRAVRRHSHDLPRGSPLLTSGQISAVFVRCSRERTPEAAASDVYLVRQRIREK